MALVELRETNVTARNNFFMHFMHVSNVVVFAIEKGE